MLGLCNYFLSFTWPLVIIFFNTFACLLKSHKPKSDNIVQLKIAICVWSFYMKNTPKNCKAPQFSKIYFIVFIFYLFIVSKTIFARFAVWFWWVLSCILWGSWCVLVGYYYGSYGNEIHQYYEEDSDRE